MTVPKIVWWDDNNASWVYDGLTGITTNLTYNGNNPKISGNIIAWLQWDGADNELMFTNGDTTIQLTNDNVNMTGQTAVQIDGNVIAWAVSDGSDNEIYYYMIPTASFTASDTVICAGDSVSFGSTSTGATDYQWFMDGSFFSSDASTEWTFPGAGSFTVMLVASDTFLTDTFELAITVNDNPTLTATGYDISCNGTNDGGGVAVASGGLPIYTYAWADSALTPIGFTPSVSNIAPGVYYAGVMDANGCNGTDTVLINEPGVLSISASTGNISCSGGSNGFINTTVSGGTVPYTYLWSGGYTGADTTNVSAGLYAVTVTDANSCTYNTSFSLTEPAPLSSGYVVVHVVCYGDSTGLINLSVSGGVTPYTYNWSNGDTTEDLSQIPAGTYSYTVTDANGCIGTDNVIVTQLTALAVGISGTDASCSGFNDGSASTSVSGGAGPYMYAWSTLATTPNISGLGAGTYSLTVTDNNNCVNVDSVVIGEAVSLAVSVIPTNITCNGSCDGNAAVTVSGGTGPYSFTWSTSPVQTGATATGLCPGVYNVDVTDALGCQTTPNTTIIEPSLLTVSTFSTNSTCQNTEGTVGATAAGGTAPYTYVWSGGATSSLGVGTYLLTVTDGNGCTQLDQATVVEVVNEVPLCIISVDSTSTMNEVVWEKPSVTNIDSFRIYRDILGVYTWVGSQAYGLLSAFVDSSVGVNPNTTSYRYALTVLDVCGNESDTSGFHETIHLTVNQGIPPEMNLIWDNYEGFGFGSYYILRDSTMAGNWEVIDSVTNISTTYTDVSPPQSGMLRYRIDVIPPAVCLATKQKNWNSSKSNTSTMLAANLAIAVSSMPANSPVCDGTATAAPSGGASPYTFLWNDPAFQTVQTAVGLCAGTYTVLVTDAFGDTASANITVTGTAQALSVSVSAVQANSPACDGSATTVVNGGIPPFTYLWDDSLVQTTATAVDLCAGDYSVLVTDSTGDTISGTVAVTDGSVGLVDNPVILSHVKVAPNPFGFSTEISYTINQAARVRLVIYNVLGEPVADCTDALQKPGDHVYEFGRDRLPLPPGIYIANLWVGASLYTLRIVRLKP